MGITIIIYPFINVQRGNGRTVFTGTLRLLKLFRVGNKTRLTYKPILRKTSGAVPSARSGKRLQFMP